jgi:hypothetical protein
MEGLERAARHLIDTFGANAARVADHRAGLANSAGDVDGTWGAIARRVREIDKSDQPIARWAAR